MATVETITDNDSILAIHEGEFLFRHYPPYARFLRQNHIIDYIKEQIRLSSEVNLPLLRYFNHLPDNELIEMGLHSHTQFLQCVENNTLDVLLKQSLQKWENDELEIVGKDDLVAEDISLTSYIRKQALLKFLHLYTADVNEVIAIIREIDLYETEACKAATETYINLLNKKIYTHSRFIESIAHTTPSIIYVYDCLKEQEVYTNKKMTEFLGYTHEDLQTLGSDIVAYLVHPADLERVKQHDTDFLDIEDNETRCIEYRIKHKEGGYKWIKTCEAAFLRNTDGTVHQKIGIAVDIDDQKKTEQKLQEREAQLLEAQSLANIGSYEWRISDDAIIATPQFLKIFEASGQLMRSELFEFVHPADREQVAGNMQHAIETNGIYDCEYRYLKEGKEKIIWSRGQVMVRNGEKIMAGTSMDVTGKHHMIQKLQRSEHLYKQAQAISHLGNYTYNIGQNTIEWTDEVYRVFGLEPQSIAITLETFMAFVHPEDREMVAEKIKESIDRIQPHNFLYRIQLADGTIKIIQARGDVLSLDNKVAYKFLGTAQDVTEKELLIERLKQSEKLYKQAQAISQVGSWTWDLKENKIEWSDELFRIFGLEPQSENITFDHYISFIHPDEQVYILGIIKDSLTTLQPYEHIYNALLPNGEHKIVHTIAEFEIDTNGQPAKLYGICQDVTLQKNIEAQLKENKEFIYKIADVTPSVISTYNIHTGKYTFVNKGIEMLLGYPAEELLEKGAPFAISIVHPDDVVAMLEKNNAVIQEANINKAGTNDIIAEFKYRVKHKNGSYRWMQTYETVFDRNKKGRIEHVLNISIDITEQEEAEQALQLKNIQLQQSNSSLEEYAYVASHDLKEPLRKISTFGDRLLISQNNQLDEEGKLYLGKIIHSSQRMQTMINDLLSVSTIYGNRAFEPCSLQEILDEVVQTLEYKIDEQGAKIIYNNLPVANIVPSQFRQLFQNLIGNSLKFVRAGVPPEITIQCEYLKGKDMPENVIAAEKYLQFTISDNGIGFDNMFSGKIFNIFQRLHGKSEYEGTGIGLAVCKRIAENHGGTVIAESIPGTGSTFFVIIPVL